MGKVHFIPTMTTCSMPIAYQQIHQLPQAQELILHTTPTTPIDDVPFFHFCAAVINSLTLYPMISPPILA